MADISNAIKLYCKRHKFDKTCSQIEKLESQKCELMELDKVFEKYFKPKTKLSFNYDSTINEPKCLLKSRLMRMNVKTIKSTKSGSITCTQKLTKEKMPDEFLLLLDNLCIDKKDARKFYENRNKWAYVTSDKKIYCAKDGEFRSKITWSYNLILKGIVG